MKVDNLNVEDMFDSYRLNRLLDIFRCELWRESEGDLYVTFLASAVHLGARHPLRPNEGEGLVLVVAECRYASKCWQSCAGIVHCSLFSFHYLKCCTASTQFFLHDVCIA